MNYQTHDTPTETRTWDTEERETYREFLSLNKRAKRLEPTEEEMRAIQDVAVLLSIWQEFEGAPSYPLDQLYGAEGKEPIPQPEANRCTRGLKFAYALRREVRSQVDAKIQSEQNVLCPVCGDEEITAFIGQFPLFRVQEGEVEMKIPPPRVIALDPSCGCVLSMEDVEYIEAQTEGATEQFNSTGV